MKLPHLLQPVFAGLALVTGAHAQVTLIDVNFPPGTGTNPTFLEIDNAVGANNTWTQGTGVLSSSTTANSSIGAASDTTIDFTALGDDALELTVEVASRTGSNSANGMFIGFQQRDNGGTGDDLWNNNPPSFGLVIPGTSSGGNSGGGLSLVANRVSAGGRDPSDGNRYQAAPTFGTTTTASINDGFTVTLTVDNSGWDIVITGIETSGGAPITGGSGNWGAGGVNDWNEFDNLMRAGLSFQTGAAGGDLNVTSITLVRIPSLDTDMDGMPDAYEDSNGLNKNDPADANLDNDATGGPDGLTNLEEYTAGTDPQDSDSDDDGLNDGAEVNGTLNPWTNGVLGTPPGDDTDPLNPDSDNDGDNDGDEITNGTDPNAPPPNSGPLFPFVDSDGDSYRDEAEIAFGSNPNDPDDCPNHTPSPAKPNVVIIYADDFGLGDMSAYGNLFGTPSPATTPSLDALAAEGVLFTAGHSSNAVCTPSRYALLTGKYNWREFQSISGHYGYKSGISGIPLLSDTTIAEYLKTHGYDTAAFGKWHLGGKWYQPGTNTRITNNPTNPATVDWARPVVDHATAHGFDYFRGLGTTINFGPYVYLHDDRMQWVTATDANGVPTAFRDATNSDPFTWLTTADLDSSVVGNKDRRASLGDPSYRQVDAGPVMINDVEAYFADRAAASDPDPFFAYVSLYSPHLPWALTAPFIGSDSGMGFYYGDWMREVDDRIGRVIDAIDNNGFREDTLLVFTADNGPENAAMSQSLSFGKDPNASLRGNKRDVWDGGTRVPFVVRWPGQAAPGMKVNDIVWQGDIFATVAAFLRDEIPASVAPDGESLLNILRGQQKPGPHREGIVVCSIRGDLGLKTRDGWKLIDSTGGGNGTSWDSSNNSIPSAAGTNQGQPKQLFEQFVDLGEDNNLISTISGDAAIRSELTTLTGSDLLGVLDQLRTSGSAALYPRVPDNDADLIPNALEVSAGLDPDSPKDAADDLDGDGASNQDEVIAGTDLADPLDVLRIIDLSEAGNDITVTWPSKLDRDYETLWSIDLLTWNSWSTQAGTGAPMMETLDKAVIDADDGMPGNLTRLFVRVAASQQ